jgi:hypothetical protein
VGCAATKTNLYPGLGITMNTARRLTLLEKVTTANGTVKTASVFGELASSISSRLGKRLVDRLDEVAVQKFPWLGPKKKTWGQEMFGEGGVGRRALMLGATAAGIGAGIKGTDIVIDAVTGAVHKRRSFNNMLAENPKLKRESQRDVKRIFRTLHSFSPRMAGDPLVAGSFLRRSLQFKEEGIQPVDIKTLVDIRKSVSGAKGESILSKAFATTAADLAAGGM